MSSGINGIDFCKSDESVDSSRAAIEIVENAVNNTIRNQLEGEAKLRFDPRDRKTIERFSTSGKCPVCGGVLISKIIFGFPGPELFQNSRNKNDTIFAGCCVPPKLYNFVCRICGQVFLKKNADL